MDKKPPPPLPPSAQSLKENSPGLERGPSLIIATTQYWPWVWVISRMKEHLSY